MAAVAYPGEVVATEASNLLPSSTTADANTAPYSALAYCTNAMKNNNDTPSTSTATVDGLPRTNVTETFLHLLKGYIGAGMLSLPWAVSQMGMVGGVVGIFSTALWTSYNCWTVVKLKRYMEKTTNAAGEGGGDTASEASSTRSNITYPDVGEWAYGGKFQNYVTACICVQQLAICTVFISFVGENLLAVLVSLLQLTNFTHLQVMGIVLPFIMGLSFIPSLKTLAPVMAAGTILLLAALGAVGIVLQQEWPDRPDTTPELKPAGVPLALCAMLYSYEGICLILPIESAMEEPEHFRKIFTVSMSIVACLLAVFASLCVYVFGEVTSGSVTAFLLEIYPHNAMITTWIMIANTAVSLSVLLTYPLQLFPAVELVGPALQQRNNWLARLFRPQQHLLEDDDDDDNDLSGFEPLPPLPEHDVASIDSMPSEHYYGLEQDEDINNYDNKFSAANKDTDASSDVASFSGVSSVTSMFPRMTMPGDSPQLRVALVLLTFAIAVVVPNVQALISLAGALAGSSTALLIPPGLELAWIEHLEVVEAGHSSSGTTSRLPPSPHTMRVAAAAAATQTNKKKPPTSNTYRHHKIKCYVLLVLGFIFMCIGTYASISDIVKIYRQGTK